MDIVKRNSDWEVILKEDGTAQIKDAKGKDMMATERKAMLTLCAVLTEVEREFKERGG